MGRHKNYLTDQELIEERNKAEADLAAMPERYLKRLQRYLDLETQCSRMSWTNETPGRLSLLDAMRAVVGLALEGTYGQFREAMDQSYQRAYQRGVTLTGSMLYPDDFEFGDE